MNDTPDTEITLGMGRILGIFFTLVALCGIFFGLGYKLGRGETTAAASETPGITQASGGPRPSAATQTVAAKVPALAEQPATRQAATPSAESSSSSQGAAGDAAASTGLYFVQVAAVSKQEDADALVDSLKKKQYSALTASTPGDKLFHVQIGPFSDIKEAEAIRTRLMNDGYNPILKK